MSKKSSDRKKEIDKAFRMGQLKGRERFLNNKYTLMEKVLSDEKFKEQLFSKPLKELNKIEKAVVFSLSMRPLTFEEFNTKKEELKNAEIKSAKHKYGIK